MKRLLIATTNPAKLAEYRLLLRGFELEPLSLKEVGISARAPESAETFAANARLKAAFYFVRAGIATLADDGGLEVDALGGAPGVMSHRWLGAAGEGIAGDRALAEEVVRRMTAVAPPRRTARIRAAAALVYTEDGIARASVTEAALEGVIAERCHPTIRPGFPYRAVLYLPERGRYLAELSEEEEARLSQRHALIEMLADELRRLAAAA
ncbi:MAG: non-canonical purine NTP pyrophosphatase [Candidatus Binataceae bacterium]